MNDRPDQQLNPYDRIRYPGLAYPNTHPDRLATLATLFGMHPAALDRCRVLEVGCGDGGNIIPMAWSLPEAQFLGIDLAPQPIAEGQAIVRELGFRNIRLLQLDLMDFPDGLGPFDYIIAHGFYSWVPPQVQDKLLGICGRHLSENGVAFVSYNTYPGCHLRNMVREMMLYHVYNASDPKTRISQARALIKFLADSQKQPDEYGLLLKSELERMMRFPIAHLFHDDLAEINLPVYFHQFIEHAARHGLQFLSEAEYSAMQANQFTEDAIKKMEEMEDNPLAREQYLDFLKCRRFRQTLLCRQDILLDRRRVKAEGMRDFNISSSAQAVSPEPDIQSVQEEEFQNEKGARMKTGHPLTKAVMMHLKGVWPGSLTFQELLSGAKKLLGKEPQEEDSQLLGKVLENALGVGFVELHVQAPKLSLHPGERPLASPVARIQTQRGEIVANLRHIPVRLEGEISRKILQMMDGTRDRAALAKELQSVSQGKEIVQHEQGMSDEGPAGFGTHEIEKILNDLAHLALIVE